MPREPDPRLRHDLADAFLMLGEPKIRYLLSDLGAVQHAAHGEIKRGDTKEMQPFRRGDLRGRKRLAADRQRGIGHSKPPPHDYRALRLYDQLLDLAEHMADEALTQLDEIVGEPPA
jgi:hypothetical protein